MGEYQIRVIGRNGTLTLQISAIHANDAATIRAAVRLCPKRETVNVWRGDVCIYSETPKAPLKLVWPINSGAIGR